MIYKNHDDFWDNSGVKNIEQRFTVSSKSWDAAIDNIIEEKFNENKGEDILLCLKNLVTVFEQQKYGFSMSMWNVLDSAKKVLKRYEIIATCETKDANSTQQTAIQND